jgi:hypothetical protein
LKTITLLIISLEPDVAGGESPFPAGTFAVAKGAKHKRKIAPPHSLSLLLNYFQ